MEQENMENIPEVEEKYVPRPWWQIWGARIGLAVFIVFLIMYYLLIFRGG